MTPARATWCGHCDEITRHVADLPGGRSVEALPRVLASADGRGGHADAEQGIALVQEDMLPEMRLRARYLRETDYGRLPPSPGLERAIREAGAPGWRAR